jgi:hypothetical protein
LLPNVPPTDMFASEEFFEIPIVGLLLLAATVPIILRSHRLLREGRRVRIVLPIGGELSLQHLMLGVLGIAFGVGLLANQLIDVALPDKAVPCVRQYQDLYKCWREHKVDGIARAPTLKTAEYDIAANNEFARAYFRRHGAVIRLLRAMAVAMVLLLIAMAIYELERVLSHSLVRRYTRAHFAIATLVLVLSAVAYASELAQVSKRALELATLETPDQLKNTLQCHKAYH